MSNPIEEWFKHASAAIDLSNEIIDLLENTKTPKVLPFHLRMIKRRLKEIKDDILFIQNQLDENVSFNPKGELMQGVSITRNDDFYDDDGSFNEEKALNIIWGFLK